MRRLHVLQPDARSPLVAKTHEVPARWPTGYSYSSSLLLFMIRLSSPFLSYFIHIFVTRVIKTIKANRMTKPSGVT